MSTFVPSKRERINSEGIGRKRKKNSVWNKVVIFKDDNFRYLNRDYWQNKKATAGSSVSSNSKVILRV